MARTLKVVEVAKVAKIPNGRPIVIGHYTLTATGLEVNETLGRPSFGEHQGVGDYIRLVHKASGFWLGDWLAYGESRQDWQERLDAAEGVTGLTRKTLLNVRAVARSVAPPERRDDAEFWAHEAVAGLPPDKQAYWLERAVTEQMDVRELRDAIRQSQRATILQGRADSMHTIDVTVQMEVEASTPFMASQIAWDELKGLLADCPRPAKVIAAHARPR